MYEKKGKEKKDNWLTNISQRELALLYKFINNFWSFVNDWFVLSNPSMKLDTYDLIFSYFQDE